MWNFKIKCCMLIPFQLPSRINSAKYPQYYINRLRNKIIEASNNQIWIEINYQKLTWLSRILFTDAAHPPHTIPYHAHKQNWIIN